MIPKDLPMTIVEMANNFNLNMDENDIGVLLEVIPDELTNGELLELEQEHIAEQEARGKKRHEKK